MRSLARWQWPKRFALVQFPNLPLIVALIADGGGRLASGDARRLLSALYFASLAVWAYEEARRGENWFRRALGVGGAVYVLASMSSALRS